MFGLKEKSKSEEETTFDAAFDEKEQAEALVKGTLAALDHGLAQKRIAREKTAQLIGSLRPLTKSG